MNYLKKDLVKYIICMYIFIYLYIFYEGFLQLIILLKESKSGSCI